MVGLHPWYSEMWEPGLKKLSGLLTDSTAGVGEIGLDRSRRDLSLDLQISVFENQLRIAANLQKPVAIHCVRSWGRLIETLRKDEFLNIKWMIHGFSGASETAVELTGLGGFLSLAPHRIPDDKLMNLLKVVPEKLLLLETDYEGACAAEYRTLLARNYRKVSDILGQQPEIVAEQVLENLNCLWGKV